MDFTTFRTNCEFWQHPFCIVLIPLASRAFSWFLLHRFETILFYENVRVHSTFNPYKCLFSHCFVALKMMAQSAWNPLTHKSTIHTQRHADGTHSSCSIADWRWDQIKKQPLKRKKKIQNSSDANRWMCIMWECVQYSNCRLFLWYIHIIIPVHLAMFYVRPFEFIYAMHKLSAFHTISAYFCWFRVGYERHSSS